MRIQLTDNARRILQRLHENGFSAYAVGGCVRDSLRGVEPHDWDFATSALPDEIERVFSDCKTVTVGKRYGTVAVILDDRPYEVTTFRLDGDYSDARHPDEVMFSRKLSDDLSRRDFTVNAMAYNEEEGLIDLFGGTTDLHYGVIRCVGVPTQRFSEDALRILRALRFASVLGFSIEQHTSEAVLAQRRLLSEIAPQRIMTEMNRLLTGDAVDFVLRRYRAVFAVFIPELSATFDFDQNSLHHNRDVYRHSVAAVKNIEPDAVLRTTMLFHDIGKPLSRTTDRKGVSHYKNHPVLGAAMTEEILRRLCCPSAFIDEVCTLIRYHDVRLRPEAPMIKRMMRTLGAKRCGELLKIQRADILAQSMYQRAEKLDTLDAVEAEYRRILDTGECYSLANLAVNGKDIIHLGVGSGERIGSILDTLLERVIEGELENEHEQLIAAACELARD